jgi:hypothetical protein
VNGDSNSYRLIIHCAVTDATAMDLYFDNFRVGPVEHASGGVPFQEPILISDISNLVTQVSGEENYLWRIGDRAFVNGHVTFNGTNTTDGTVALTLPSGYTVDESKLPSVAFSSADEFAVGVWQIRDNSPGVRYGGPVTYQLSDGKFYLELADGSGSAVNPSASVPVGLATTDGVSWSFNVPIAEWAGETVSMANSRVEYAYNSSTNTTTSDTSSFAYGPGGAQFQSITVGLNRRVRFQTPIQSTDKIEAQVSQDGLDWYPAESYFDGTVQNWTYQNPNTFGFGRTNRVAGSETDVDIAFGAYANASNATYGGAGASWSAAGANVYYWRVVKSSNPLGIGTGLATSTQAGAVGGSQGVVPAAGFIGEKQLDTLSSDYTVTTSWVNTGLSITLDTGVWMIGYGVTAILQGDATNANSNCSVAVYDGSSRIAESIALVNWGGASTIPASEFQVQQVSRTQVVAVSGSTTYTVQAIKGNGTVSISDEAATSVIADPDSSSALWAVRIA